MEIEKAKELRQFYRRALLDDCIPFWMKSDLIDERFGGFITSIDRAGRSYCDEKSVWFQGRCLWTFAALCNRYGVRPEWAAAAARGAEFIKSHCIDADGRMFFIVSRDGKPIRKRRYFASESFLVFGFSEYYGMTGNPEDLALAERYFDLMYGIYRNPANDPYFVTPKYIGQENEMNTMSDLMDLISTVQIVRRYAVGRREKYDRIAREILDDILRLHYRKDLKCILENVCPDGRLIDTPAGREINPGHCLENAWFLMNLAQTQGNEHLTEQALDLLRWSIERGWDSEYGGIRYFCDVYGRPPVQLEHDMKLWWVHNEALIATLAAHLLTGDSQYEVWFDRIHEYGFSHFADREFGEWYGYLHRDGTVSHEQKGSLWKGPFHYPRCLRLCEQILTAMIERSPLPSLL